MTVPSRLLPVSLAGLLLGVLAVSLSAGCRTGAPGDGGGGVEQVSLSVPDSARTFTPSLDGPLRVLSATPRGTLRDASPAPVVAVTFSRPMVPLGEAPPVPEDALTLSPAVPGRLHWEGTQTLVFVPDGPLPPATRMQVRLNPVLSDLNGEPLEAGYDWTFETPRPRVVHTEPAAGDALLPRQPSLRLHFNLPVAATAVRPFLDGPDSAAWTLANDGDSTLVLSAEAPLDRGQSVSLTLREGLPTPAGPLGMAETTTLSYRIHPALRVESIRSTGRSTAEDVLPPGQGLQIEFSTPVRFGDLRAAVRLSPSVEWPAGIEARDAQTATTHVLPLPLAAETAYRLQIEGLRDGFGQSLSTTRSVRTGAYDPRLSMDTGRLVIESEQFPVLPLRVTNVDRVDLGLTRIAPEDIVPSLRTYDTRYYGRAASGQPEAEPVPFQRTLDIDRPRNEPGIVPLYLDTLLTGQTGVVGVRLRWQPPGRSGRTRTALAQVTDLGLTAKFSPHRQLVVVSRLSTGTPVAGARVTLRNRYNEVLWTGTTDAEGRARAPGWEELAPDVSFDALGAPPAADPPAAVSPLYALVEHRGDVAFTGSLFNDGVEPYRFGLNYDWNPAPRTAAGSVFTDRGLYRAGETVHWKAILRAKSGGTWTSVTDSVRMLVRDPREELVFDAVHKPSDVGTVDTSWALPAGAARGRYTIRVASAADTSVTAEYEWQRGGLATGSFRVASFRRSQFSVTARSAADAYVAGDFFEGSVAARYLFGAGMAGQPVRTRLVQQSAFHQPPGYAGYRFGPLGGTVYDELAGEETTLDSTSRAELRTQIPRSETGAPTEIAWSGTVTSPSRQEISDRTTATVHPARFYIGLRTETTLLDLSADSLLTVDVLTTDPGGVPVGEKSVAVDLIRREWDSVRQVGADGRMRWRSEPTETVVGRRTLTTVAGSAQRLSLAVPQGGQYLVRARGRDLRGNAVRSETTVYATGSDYAAWRRDDDDRVPVIAEKSRYAPGETARLMVQSPYEAATALVTIEREGILESRVERVTGSTPSFEIPITDDHLPNIFVSVILLNGRTAPPQTTADPGAPGFKIGYTQLRVDAASRRLTVALSPDRETYRPGDEATVAIRLTDADGNGVPGEVAFSAADAGVLNRIAYRLPDPFDAFYGPRPLGVTTSESRADLVEQRSYGQKSEAVGGGGGEGDAAMRTDFRPSAHWAPAVRTDRRGRAAVTFRFPESLTTFRLMASALTADHRFGSGQTDVTVTKPLVLQPALPRFARVGDRFEAGVLVSNRTDASGTATITADADGLDRTGPAEQSVSLAPGATKEVRFDWSASEAGTASVRFRASLNGDRDAFEHRLPVEATRIPQTTAQFASLTGPAADEQLRLPDNRVADAGSLGVQLSSTALVGLEGALTHLFNYPYGCLEQRTSRIRPLLAGADVISMFDLGPQVLGGNRNRLVQAWLQDLSTYRSGESLGMWPSSVAANPYVSAYVLLALAEAETAGYRLPQPLTDEVTEALVDAVRRSDRKPPYYSDEVWAHTRAWMLYALARHGRVLETEISALVRRRPANPETLAHLLRTVTVSRSPVLDRFEKALADRLRDRVRVEATRAYLDVPDDGGFGWVFASTVRATALGLTALLEHDPGPDLQPLAEQMIQYLMDARSGDHWASTQDNAAVLDAFRAYVSAYESAAPDLSASVLLVGREILTASFRGRSLETARASLAADRFPEGRTIPIRVQREGDGRLYYSLRLRTAAEGPVERASRGLRVQRQIQRLDDRGEPVGDWLSASGEERVLAPGQLVRVRLRVVAPAAQTYVAVDDALPAGLEPVQTDFATTDAGLTNRTGAGAGRWWGSFNHTELRDDRVLLFADYLRSGEHTYTYLARATTAGTFHHPPARAEMMYAPETNGRTASGTLRVEESSPQALR